MQNILIYCFLLLTVIAGSCKSKKTTAAFPGGIIGEITALPTNVNITVRVHVPHCGGVAPSEEQMNLFAPEIHKHFVIVWAEDNADSNAMYSEVVTDSSGTIRVSLPVGKYCLIRKEKHVPFETFLKSNKGENDEYFEYNNVDCFYKWWKACTLSFEVADDSENIKLETTIYPNCFTGENPCKFYKGPYPP
jgi:hypothetical protein